MRIKREELPTVDEFVDNKLFIKDGLIAENYCKKLIGEYLKLHLDRIKYEYEQYQDALDGYRHGSASISEVTAAHDEFLKLL